jgi:hypothetical protein
MHTLDEHSIQCPYCWELQTVFIDPSVAEQTYVEDCHVCCQPILLRVRCEADILHIEALRENG